MIGPMKSDPSNHDHIKRLWYAPYVIIYWLFSYVIQSYSGSQPLNERNYFIFISLYFLQDDYSKTVRRDEDVIDVTDDDNQTTTTHESMTSLAEGFPGFSRDQPGNKNESFGI
jgi:hypothetical protein